MTINKGLLFVAVLGCFNTTHALSERDVAIITGCSGVAAAVVAPLALHGLCLQHTQLSSGHKIGFDALAAVVAGGSVSGILYLILRQQTPQYKIAFAKRMLEQVKIDKFYSRMQYCVSDGLAVVSALFFGPTNPLDAGMQHIYMLQHRLDLAIAGVTEAFHETKDIKSASVFHNECATLIKDIIDIKRAMENIICGDPADSNNISILS